MVEQENIDNIECFNCKREIATNSSFCKFCGAPVNQKVDILRAEDSIKNPRTYLNETNHKGKAHNTNSHRKFIIIVLCVVMVLGGYYLLNKDFYDAKNCVDQMAQYNAPIG